AEGELVPEPAARSPLAPRRVWVGASMGALASATLALRRAEREPESARDDAVLALSGAFLGTPEEFDPYCSRRSWLAERLRAPGARLPGAWPDHVAPSHWLRHGNREA